MKITPQNISELSDLMTLGLGQLITNVDLKTAQFLFEENETEVFAFPIIHPFGMALLLHHLEKKHKMKSNIFITQQSFEEPLLNTLKSFINATVGAKAILLIWSGEHWRTAYLEKIQNKLHIAVIDSLGISGKFDNPVEAVVEANSTLQEQVILYRSVNKLQIDTTNCGIIALRVAQKLTQEPHFFKDLLDGNLLLTTDEAISHFKTSNQMLTTDLKTNHFFVLPPQYFALAQRKTYLTHYKKEFGERKGIYEFVHFSKKEGQFLSLDDMFNRKHREKSISTIEGTGLEKQNYTVLYFCNKYIETALLTMMRTFLKKKLTQQAVIKKIKDIATKHTLDNKVAQKRLTMVQNNPAIEQLTQWDTLEKASLQTINTEERNILNKQHQDHYVILTAEEVLEKQQHSKKAPTYSGAFFTPNNEDDSTEQKKNQSNASKKS